MYYYLMWMAWIMLALTIIAVIIDVVKTVNLFMVGETTMKKCGAILCAIVIAVMGSAISILFYQVAELSK